MLFTPPSESIFSAMSNIAIGIAIGFGGVSVGISGPQSTTDNAIPRWNGSTGAALEDSDIKIADSIGSPSDMQLLVRNDSGTSRMEVTGGYLYLGGSRLYLGGDTANATLAARSDTSMLTLGSGWGLAWTSASNDAVNASPDVGLKRSAAGRLRVTNGSTGYGEVELASGVIVKSGTGTPEGSVAASVGSLYLRTDGGSGTSIYVKESGSGNTGWVAK